MELSEWFVFLCCLLQSLDTGCFLTLDVATKTLQNEWGFDLDTMVSIGTVGYSLGFLGVAVYGLCINKISPKISIIIGGTITSVCWLGIYLTLCKKCITWPYAMIFEGGIGCGTAISYLSAATIITKSSFGDGRKLKLIFLALFVAIGSIISFIIFVGLNDVKLTVLIMFIYNSISTILLLISSFINKDAILIESQPIDLPLIDRTIELKKSFSVSFGIYLFGLNLTFGIIMTFINSANSILDSFEAKWDTSSNNTQFPLVCFVIGNFIGRFSGIFIKNGLNYTLHLFSIFSLIIAICSSILLLNWNLTTIFILLGIIAIFFGIIWAITMPLAREFYDIQEDRSLALTFFGMSFGPLVFGLFASWLYKYKKTKLNGSCNYNCFWTYLSISSMATYSTVFIYFFSWYIRKNERNRRSDQ